MTPTFHDIQEAHKRIHSHIHNTPVLTCSSMNQMTDCSIFFKCENFQKAGAFKSRGACNVVFSLTDKEAKRGVVTHSSGNHAGALARAAQIRGINAYIVMPSTAPEVKVAAVKEYGGQITFCKPTLQAREKTAEQVITKTGASLVHPYNDVCIIEGQGTAALELIQDVKNLDFLFAPVGGGGLLSGTAITTRALIPNCHVIGCEPKNADDAYRSKQAGHIIPSENPQTIADGLLTSLGDKTFPIIQDLVDDIILVTEEEILRAMRTVWERMKIIIEPSAAVPLAAVFSNQLNLKGKRVGIIFSGGNVDLSQFFASLKKYD